MKESEAKEKVCPFIHLATQNRNDGSIYFSYTYCQTSKCMAWVDTTPKEWTTARSIFRIYPKPIPSGYCAKMEANK